MLRIFKSKFTSLWEFIFESKKDLRPAVAIPAIKTNLKAFRADEKVLVWLGHSSVYMQLNGKRILIDPVLVSASPVSFINKPFSGAALYQPEDMPDIDLMIVTHDHLDHLDYNTVLKLKDRVKKVICPLGVGEHFEYWGVEPSKINELDWYQNFSMENGLSITAVPARHFSGRGLTQDRTLWAGYVVESSMGKIYISGDTGYDSHFKKIRETLGPIDLAIMENGQYNDDWKYIHMLPQDLNQAITDLGAKRMLTYHNSKYALSKHNWKEPLENTDQFTSANGIDLLTSKIGQTAYLDQRDQQFEKWWKKICNLNRS